MEAVTFFGIDVGFLGAWWGIVKPYLTADRVIAIGAGSYSFFTTWKLLERNMKSRLDEFLDNEHKRLKVVRDNIKNYRVKTGTPFLGDFRAHTNEALDDVLAQFTGNVPIKFEKQIRNAVAVASSKENEAIELAEVHKKQKAVAYLLLGAQLVRRGEHRVALAQFNNALEIDAHDEEALEYAGHQLVRLENPKLALKRFDTLAEIAQASISAAKNNKERAPGRLLLARAHRGRGLAYVLRGRNGSAYGAYTTASEVFPIGYGPPIDLADIHQLRGRVAIELGFTRQADESLTKAHQIFSDLIKENGEVAGMARKGLLLVQEALLRLHDLQNQNAGDNGTAEELVLEDA